MFPSFLTAACWAFSVVFAARSSRLVGGSFANFGRMLISLILLAAWAHCFGQGVAGGKSFWSFFVSGVVGFGLGDIALFLALTRIGPRLTILLTQCLAAPFGALIEWLWLGTRLRSAQLFCAAIILLGVAMALAPQRHIEIQRRTFFAGAIFGVIAALGQALGAVISRRAYFIAHDAGLHIDGGTAAYQRMLGGILIAAAFFAVVHRFLQNKTRTRQHTMRALPWIAGNALAGPTVGVAFYQWALAIAPSGVVLPIVATTPVFTIPLAWFFDNDRPGARSIIGGLIAVAGAIALTQV